jgi:hypothetical protein
MTSSWKIGAFSGLVAGIVWGIVNSFIVISFLNLGLPYSYYEPPNVTPLTEIFLFEIIFNTVFGIIFALIFSKIYEAIPGKSHALKGLFFGLGLYFLICIRSIIFLYSYGLIILVLNLLFTISPIIYGLILGILYKTPIKEFETKRDIKDGVIPGAITGLIFGFVVIIMFVTSAYLGFVFLFTETVPDYVTNIEFIINQYGAHTVINMFLMACFGAIYVRFYDVIPGKELIKGAIFGFLIWVIIDLYWGLSDLTHGSLSNAIFSGLIIPDMYIAVGILIEGFYSKRWKALPIAAAIFIFTLIKTVILTPLLTTN